MDAQSAAPNNGTESPGPGSPAATSGQDADANRGPMMLGVCWSMTGLAAVFLGLRIYVKLSTHRKLYWDDFLLIASWFMLAAFSGTTTNGVSYGIGVHHAFAHPDSMVELQLHVVIATVFSVLGAAWSKTSFAITILRLTTGGLHYIIWFVIVSMNTILTFNAVLHFLWCQPVYVAWNAGRGGTCWDKNVIIYYSIAAAAYSAAMDIFLALMPWLVIMKLKMRMNEKIGAAVCMSLGVVAAFTSIMRALYIPAIYSTDYTWDEVELFVWTAAELATTIIAASIPVLRVLLRTIVTSTQRRKTEGVTNTFKTGTYMCSTAVGRAQSYKRMDAELASQKSKTGERLRGISEDRESEASVGLDREKAVEDRMESGGIVKTEEIQVEYDSHAPRPGRNTALGFELEEVPPRR